MKKTSKLTAVYTLLRKQIRSPEDLAITGGKEASSTILFSLLAFVLNLNTLILGEYGTGKTTLAQLICSILAGVPWDVVQQSQLRASPETSEATIVGRPHLGALNKGEEKVVWAIFPKSPAHIIDELPRMPEVRQALLLEGVRTGKWTYLGQMLTTKPTPIYATANWEELGGSFDITPALRDRFAVAVETFYPGANVLAEIAENPRIEQFVEEAGLNYRAKEAAEILLAPEFDAEALDQLQQDFKNHIRKNGIPTITDEEISAINGEIKEIPFSETAGLFYQVLISSLNFCPRKGMKRSARFGEGQTIPSCPADCKFANLACGRILSGGSRRKERDIRLLAKAVAWFAGAKKVETPHIKAVTPFALWHRSTFSESFLASIKPLNRRSPVQLEAAKESVEELEREFRLRRDLFIEAIAFVRDNPKAAASGGIVLGGRSLTEDQLHHPFLVEVIRFAKN